MANPYVMAYSELHDRLKRWDTYPIKTEAQIEHYPCEPFKLTQLGNAVTPTGEDSLRLLKDDGWDGDHVGSVSPTTASQYGWRKEYPVNPKPRDLLRFGLFFHLGFYKTLILIVKSSCEQYLYKALLEAGEAGDLPMILLIEKLTTGDARLVDYANDWSQHLKAAELFQLFQAHHAWAAESGYGDERTFALLIGDIVTEKVQAYPLDSEYTDRFILNRETERTGISHRDSEVQDQYYQLKQEWTELKNGVELLLLQLEKIQDKYAQVQLMWSRQFGETELRILSLKCRREELAYIINIKESNSGMDFEEVQRLAEKSIAEKRERYEAERRQLEWLLTTAKIMDRKEALTHFAAGGISGERLAEYDTKITEMLRKLRNKVFFRTHPDYTARESFTDKQRQELLDLYQSLDNLMKLSGLSARDKLPFVDSLLKKAERIWKTVGVDTDEYDLTVILEEPAKMVEILKAKIKSMEEEDSNLRNDIFLLLCDPEYTEKEAILSNSETLALKEQELALELEALERQTAEAEQAVNDLFARE